MTLSVKKQFSIFFVFISGVFSIVHAEGVIRFPVKECGGVSSPVETVTKDTFSVSTECTKGVSSSTYSVKGKIVDKDTFDKAFQLYALYGGACAQEEMGEKKETINGVVFTKVCGLVGAFPTFFIGGKQVMNYETFANSVFVSGLKQSIMSLISLSRSGPVCDAATSTLVTYQDKMLRSLCEPGKAATYYVDGATSTFGAFAQAKLTLDTLKCPLGATSTTKFSFSSHMLARSCNGKSVFGSVYVDGATSSVKAFSDLYQSLASQEKAKVQEVYASSTSVVNASCGGLLSVEKSLTYGTKSKEVLEVQKKLFALGFLHAIPNGYYGSGTLSAVKAFQDSQALPVTGMVGRLTLGALKAVCGKI
jgi:hypothetical protein